MPRLQCLHCGVCFASRDIKKKDDDLYAACPVGCGGTAKVRVVDKSFVPTTHVDPKFLHEARKRQKRAEGHKVVTTPIGSDVKIRIIPPGEGVPRGCGLLSRHETFDEAHSAATKWLRVGKRRKKRGRKR